MRRRLTALTLLTSLVQPATAEGLYGANSPVVSFTTEAQIPTSEKPSFVLLEFYSAWCGHCQKFAPQYEAIALAAKTRMAKLTVAAVNCAEYDAICNKHSITSYPTIMLYPGELHFSGLGLGANNNVELVLGWVKEKFPDAEELPVANYSSDYFKARVNMALEQAAAASKGGATGGGLGDDLMRTAADLGISPQEDEDSPRPMLRPRQMPRPAPVTDVLTAARYSLYHDVAKALLKAAPKESSSARKRLGALRAWLHALHHALPHDRDGGTAATGTGELLAALHGKTELPDHEEWMGMLARSGFPDAPDEWDGCASNHTDLHAYPCSLWILFHTLLAHSSEPDALPNLHTIVGYVTHFFGCADCSGHFAVLSARLETDIRELFGGHHGGRERATLWLWQAHNKVNDRLAAEALVDSPQLKYAEFAKIQWPPRADCHDCRELSMPPRAGVRQELRWRHDTVYRQLLETYCLEPRFECWGELTKLSGKRRAPAAEMSGYYGTLISIVCVVMLLVLAWCGCAASQQGICESSDAPAKPGKKKSDHVV